MMRRMCFFTAALLVFAFTFSYAQNTNEQLSEKEIPKKIYETRKINPHAPVIDGLMNDEAWEKVEWASDFTQRQPCDGDPPSQKTAFKILYDDNNLYVFIKAYDTEPEKIKKIMARRDQFSGDMVEVNIDSDFDRLTAFSFTAMASGAKGDEAITEDGNRWDSSWDPIWYLGTSVDDDGWNAEMRIPFSQLRFGSKEEHVWGFQVMRHIFRLEERSNWQWIPREMPGFVHHFGELRGIRNIQPSRQIEMLPYTVGRTEHFQKEAGNPFADGTLSVATMGLDGKIGLTNDLILDFTINPDFGQVEADPSVVNLTAFESYFSEQRPFFIEGKSIYDFPPSRTYVISDFQSDNLFYSRRIGRSPRYYPDLGDDEHMRMPEATTILGAFKLSGKTKNGLSIGVLESVTSEEKAEIDNLGDRRKESVEPLTNYFVSRLSKDFNKGETVLGGMFTAVNRSIKNPDMNYVHRAAYTGGFDFLHNFKDRKYYIGVKGMFSNVRGDKEAILNTQTASARYYQRPDAEYVSVDSNLTSLSGYSGTVVFGKNGGGNIKFQTSASYRSPGFELNDTGYMRVADIIHNGTWVGYQRRSAFSIFRNFYINFNYWTYLNSNAQLLEFNENINFNTQFKNYWYLNGSFSHYSDERAQYLLRGGPTFVIPGAWTANLNVNSDQRKKFYYNLGGYSKWGNENSARILDFWCGGTIRPSDALRFSVYPEYIHERSKLQYIDMVELENGDPRYIFAEISQKTMILVFRLNYNITPDLSIQYYGQPFVSAGKYKNIKRITDPDANQFSDRYHTFTDQEIDYNAEEGEFEIDENQDGTNDYSIGEPDFNFRQFRSNLVVRWEYSPGSTLYLVWSQSRTDYIEDGSFSYRNDMRDLFNVYPHNVFLLKFNRWFSL